MHTKIQYLAKEHFHSVYKSEKKLMKDSIVINAYDQHPLPTPKYFAQIFASN